MRIIVKYTCVIFLFLSAELFFSCTGNTPVAKRPLPPYESDTVTIIKYSKNEIKIQKGLDSIFSCRVKETCFNGCVIIARKGRMLYKKAIGYADHENKKMLTINSAFQLASASKPFTATAILMLMEKGKLKLDDDVKKYITDFPYDGITIKMLLCHRSGLPNYMYFAEDYFNDSKKLVSNSEIVKCLINNKPALYYPPNKKFEYCNTNYCLLGYLVEKISGEKFADFMRQNIFDPLGMKNSWIIDRKNDSAYSERTRGYMGSKWKPAEVNLLDGVYGDKNAYSSAYDMFIFDRALYSGKLLSAKTLEAAYTGYSHEHPGVRNYGLGWRLIDRGKGWKVVYHNGWWHGYNTVFFRRPKDETLIVILCNHYDRSAYHIQDILQVLDNSYSDTELEKEE